MPHLFMKLEKRNLRKKGDRHNWIFQNLLGQFCILIGKDDRRGQKEVLQCERGFWDEMKKEKCFFFIKSSTNPL